MKRIAASFVPDDPEDLIIDEVFSNTGVYGDDEKSPDEYDRFKHVDIRKQSKKIKNKFYRLRKKFEGVDGAKAKFKELEDVDGYGLYESVEPPYNLEALAGLLDTNSVLQATISARVMNTVGLGYDWTRSRAARKKTERARGKPDSEQRVKDEFQKEIDKIEELIEHLNDEETLTEVLVKVWYDVLSVGNGYLEIGRTLGGKIGYVGHIPAVSMRVRRNRDGFVQLISNKVTFFRNFQDHETSDPINGDPRPNEVIHFKMYSPSNNYYGVPPAVSAISAIVGDKFAKQYNIDYFENKAIPRYALILKGAKFSQKSKKEIINYFKNEIKGNNHGTLVIPVPATVGKDVELKFEKLEAGTQESSFDKYRKSNRDEVVIAYRVPAPKVGILDNANLAVSRDADKTFKSQVIGPDQRLIAKKMNRVIKELTNLLEFKFVEIDVIDEDIRSRIHERYLRTEVLTPNEVREDLRRPARSDGDEILPYPTNAKLKAEKERAKNGGGGSGGGEFGNSNSSSGSPPKSSQDGKAGGDKTPEEVSGTNAERGEDQDQGGRNR